MQKKTGLKSASDRLICCNISFFLTVDSVNIFFCKMYVTLSFPIYTGCPKGMGIYIYLYIDKYTYMLNEGEKMFSIADSYNAFLRKESREWKRIVSSEEILSKKMRLN